MYNVQNNIAIDLIIQQHKLPNS